MKMSLVASPFVVNMRVSDDSVEGDILHSLANIGFSGFQFPIRSAAIRSSVSVVTGGSTCVASL